jgi:tRNA(fMet)-specific endonuclease VapC
LTSGKFLLDTNIVIALFAEDSAVKQRISGTAEVFVSIIVLGELYYGALKSSRVESNLETIARFASAIRVLACDSSTAAEYGRLKNFLREKVVRFPRTTFGLRQPQNNTV